VRVANAARKAHRELEDLPMDRRQFFGDSVAGTLLRLVLLSVVVGIIFSVLGITPFNLLERLQHLIRNVMNLGMDAVGWAVQYFLLGAVIVFPIWFLVRLLGRKREPRP
jgi:Na+/H+-dicarboxylate symporter